MDISLTKKTLKLFARELAMDDLDSIEALERYRDEIDIKITRYQDLLRSIDIRLIELKVQDSDTGC